MAKYQVKRGDTLPQIATKFKTTVSRLKELNKVYSVSRGQEIEVPNQYPGANSFFGPVKSIPGADFNWTGLTPYTQVKPNTPRVPQPVYTPGANSFIAPNPNAGDIYGNAYYTNLTGASSNYASQMQPRQWFNTTNPTTNYTTSINAQQQYMSQFPGQGYMSPAVRQQQYMSQFPGQGTMTNNGVTVVNPPTQAMTPQRPQGTYTGNPQGNANDAAWVNYWNWQAANPSQVTPQAPTVMTKSQIWEMKKRARVAKREQEAQDQASYAAQQNQYTPFFTGNNVANLALRAR